jgi:putative peptidoglycan lipid II flippase
MSQMLKSSGAMVVATLMSRILGMLRESAYAALMGDGPVAGAFKLAFKIPNLFRRLLGEGALTAAFIPIFKEKEKNAGELEMWRAANAVISGLVIVTAAVVGLVILGVSIALAVHTYSEITRLMLELLRLMFPYLLLVCVAAVFMGMLNARGHFFIPALGAAILNVVMISSVVFLAPRMGRRLPEQMFGLAIGVLFAGFAQAAFQAPTLWREGFRYRWVSPWKNETVKLVVRRMIPSTIGVAAFQINVLAIDLLVYFIDPQMFASFDYSVRLMELPQGLFGITLATYLLSALSGFAVEKRYDDFRTELRTGLGYMIFVNLIATILLVVLAEPIIRLLFERLNFDANSTARAAFGLEFLAPGLVAFSTVNILARAFYALGDTHTPMKISVVCLVFNLFLAAIFILPLKQGGLGLANTCSALLNVCLLFYALRRKLGQFDLAPLARGFICSLAAMAVAGVVAWFGSRLWIDHVGMMGLTRRIGHVFVPATAAGLVYLAVSLALKIPAAKDIVGMVLRSGRR